MAGEFLAAEAGDGQRPGGAGAPDGGRDDGDLSWYGDSDYGTGDLRGATEQAGHTAVIKPKPLRPAVEGGFTVDDFTVDEEQRAVTCPAGHTVALSRTRVATFGVACCDCPLREQCTTSKTGRKLVLHERDDLLRSARAGWAADTGLRQDYMTHPAQRRAGHRPGRHLPRPPPQAPLPRNKQPATTPGSSTAPQQSTSAT